jgi:hypothetical protein
MQHEAKASHYIFKCLHWQGMTSRDLMKAAVRVILRMGVRVNPDIVSADSIPAKSLGSRGGFRFQADAPVRNTGMVEDTALHPVESFHT